MDITPLIPEGRQIIQGYGADGFKVNGVVYPDPILVFPEGTRNWNNLQSFSDINENSFDDLASASSELDVVLFGTGAKMEFVSPKLKAALKQKGLVIEAMDSGAACRTYNVLMAEGRRVAAALLPVV